MGILYYYAINYWGMGKDKFIFTTDFQYDLLKYTLTDKNGPKVLGIYNDSYFTLLEHAIIAFTIKRYYKKKNRIPGKTIFIEELIKTFSNRDFRESLTEDNKKEIINIANSLFTGTVKDGDDIIESVEKFAKFIDLKNLIERVDLLDYSQYDRFSKDVQKAISPRLQSDQDRGMFLVKDVVDRQVKRRDISPIVPLPYTQLNKLTNAGGYARGSIFVILDKAKKFKTGMLVNIAVTYNKKGKNVLVIDLDNGESEIITRIEQSYVGHSKSEILSGDFDNEITKKLSNKSHEVVVKRFPALVTNANHIKDYMNYLYSEHGLRIDELVIDYIGKMGAISGKDSLHERISDAYIDIGNLALEMGIEHVWTAQHVTRNAAKLRMATKYDSTDIAGSIDVSRHVQAIYGLNRSIEEENEGIQRLEIVDQRDGKPRGRAVFKIDMETQRALPLKGDELDEYYEKFAEHIDRVNNSEVDDENEDKPKKVKGYPNKKKHDLE